MLKLKWMKFLHCSVCKLILSVLSPFKINWCCKHTIFDIHPMMCRLCVLYNINNLTCINIKNIANSTFFVNQYMNVVKLYLRIEIHIPSFYFNKKISQTIWVQQIFIKNTINTHQHVLTIIPEFFVKILSTFF